MKEELLMHGGGTVGMWWRYQVRGLELVGTFVADRMSERPKKGWMWGGTSFSFIVVGDNLVGEVIVVEEELR